MSAKIQHAVILWLHGLVGAAIGSLSSGVLAVLGTEITGAADFTARQLVTVMIANAIIGAALYLRKSPLPPISDGDSEKPPTLGIGSSGFTG